MQSSASPSLSQPAMATPYHNRKSSNRPQSTVARNFMSELDQLFKLDSTLDSTRDSTRESTLEMLNSLDKTVHEKKQAVTTQTQELEALEAQLRATEERLNQAKTTSPARRKDGQQRSPTQDAFPGQDKARQNPAVPRPDGETA